MNRLFGIKNCDSVKKARQWLDSHTIDYQFHDLRIHGLDRQTIDNWIEQAGWESLLNRRGTTWRKLDKTIQDNTHQDNVSALLLAYPSMIKRPVLELDGAISLGFSPDLYRGLFDLFSSTKEQKYE